MPYLDPEQRAQMDEGEAPDTAGKLNYVITTHALALAANDDVRMLETAIDVEVTNYLATCARVGYAEHNTVMGVLTCALREWERRRGTTTLRDQAVADTLVEFARDYYNTVVAPYEDEKIKQNGDVYSN